MSDYKPLACLPVLPLRGIVVFPGCVTHFDVGRSRSARAVEEAMRADQMIFLVAQRDVQCDEPKKADLYQIGTVAYVRQILRLPGDNMRILVEGKYRAQLTDMIHAEPYLFARAMELDEPGYHAAVPRTQALVRQAHQLFEQFIDLAVKSGQENLLQGSATDDAGELADFIAQNATFGYEDKQKILETLPPVHRLELCVRTMAKELDILRLESEINDQVQQNVNQNQRDYYLREQLHVIREELGEDDDSDADSYRAKIQALKLPKETEEKLLREVSRLRASRPAPPRPPCCAITLIPSSTCRGTRRRRSGWMSSLPRRSSTRIISASSRSKSAFSRRWPCGSWLRSCRGRSSAWSAPRAWARRPSPSRSHAR